MGLVPCGNRGFRKILPFFVFFRPRDQIGSTKVVHTNLRCENDVDVNLKYRVRHGALGSKTYLIWPGGIRGSLHCCPSVSDHVSLPPAP